MILERLSRLADDGDLAAEAELAVALKRRGDIEGLAMLGDHDAMRHLARAGNVIWGAMQPRLMPEGEDWGFGPTGDKPWRTKSNYPAWIQALSIRPVHWMPLFDLAYRQPFSSPARIRKQGKYAVFIQCDMRMFSETMFAAGIGIQLYDETGKHVIHRSRFVENSTSWRVARLKAAHEVALLLAIQPQESP